MSEAVAASKDVFHQSLTLVDDSGTLFNITIDDIAAYNVYSTRICINYGSQLGASAVLLIVILMLTSAEKRRSPIFICNSLSLLFNIPRTLFASLYFTGPWYWPYAFFAGDYSRVPTSAINISIAGSVFYFLILVPIMISLVFQVQVIMVTAPPAQRFWIKFVSFTIAMVALSFRFALSVVNGIMIQRRVGMADYYWLLNGTNITLTLAICFFCAVFLGKLGYAIVQRKKLGMKKFGPMQVIFIMGCQTLVLPAIFSALQYDTNVPEFGSQVYTIVALCLPLSAIWAASTIDEGKISPPAPGLAHKFGFGSFGTGRKSSHHTLSTSNTTKVLDWTRETDGHKFVDLEASATRKNGDWESSK